MIDMTQAQLRDRLVFRLSAEVALVNNDVPAACGLLGQFARLQAPAPIQDFAWRQSFGRSASWRPATFSRSC